MKKTFKKILISILLILILNNFIMSNILVVFATDGLVDAGNAGEEVDDGWIGSMLTGTIVGALTLPIRLLAVYAGKAINYVTALVAYTQDGENAKDTINPFDILFNKVKLVDANVFKKADEGTIVNTIRVNVAGWYFVMRALAVAILLVVLVYVGIRMAISTVASEQAKYKTMFVDWVISIAIVFLIHYLIIFVFYINDSIVDSMEKVANTDSINISETIDEIYNLSKKWIEPLSLPATVIYCLICWDTLALLISYFKRMLKIAFLIIIAPLITITYSIDKMGDNRAQALGTWLKEFIYTVLLQSFHCVIYLTMVSTAFKLLIDSKGNNDDMLAAGIIAIICIKFMKEAEKLVGKIFSFSDQTSNISLASGAATAAVAMRYSKNAGKAAGRAAGKGLVAAFNAPQNIKNGVMDMKANMHAIATAGSGKGKSFSQRKDDYYNNYGLEADERERNLQDMERNSGLSEEKLTANKEKRSQEVAEKTKQLMEQKGYSYSKASAMARNEVSKRHMKEKNRGAVGRTISGVSGRVKRVKNAALDIGRNSLILKQAGKYAKTSVAAAAGVIAGTAAYSANTNNDALFTSFGSGVAAYNATSAGIDEFFKTTMTSFAGSTRNSLKSLGVSNEADAAAMLTRILANGDKYESEDEIKELIDSIKAELSRLGINSKEVYRIQNTIQKEIASGNTVNPEELVKRMFGANNVSPGLMSATRKLSNFENEKNIYNLSQQAMDLGISDDRFINSTINSMTDSDFIDAVNSAVEGSLVDIAENDNLNRSDVEGLSVEDKKNLMNEIDRMLKSAEKELGGFDSYGIENKVIQEKVARLEQNKAAVAAELQKDFDANAKEIVRQVKEAEKKLDADEASIIARLTLDRQTLERKLEEEVNNKTSQLNALSEGYKRDMSNLSRDEDARRKQAINDAKNDLR